MTRLNRSLSVVTLTALVGLAAAVISAQSSAQSSSPGSPGRRIAVWGSSVANGTGDELRKEGYTGRLRELLAPRGWEVLNQSRGGDNTVRIAPRFEPVGPPDPQTRYLTTVNPNYVLIGLSLGNEGIANVATKAEKDAVYTQFETGLRGFVEKSRARHITPIITLCYTRNDFTAVEYEYTRRMNLQISRGWDVPSVNFLGAVDDGHGKWVDGFWNDSLHPDATGHTELTTTFVPTLFDALEKGKPMPSKSTDAGFARVTANGADGAAGAPLSIAVADTMHPFTFAFSARAQSDGVVASVSGVTLAATTVKAAPARGANANAPGGPGGAVRLVTTLTAAAPFASAVSVTGGVWTYTAADGKNVASPIKADSAWHRIVLTHYTARGETLLYVDGKLAGSVSERLEPARFVVGGSGDAKRPSVKQTDVKDLMIYRAGMNADEIAALDSGTLLQASLEVYAPLTDARFEAGKSAENRAQSTTPVTIGGSVAHQR